MDNLINICSHKKNTAIERQCSFDWRPWALDLSELTGSRGYNKRSEGYKVSNGKMSQTN